MTLMEQMVHPAPLFSRRRQNGQQRHRPLLRRSPPADALFWEMWERMRRYCPTGA